MISTLAESLLAQISEEKSQVVWRLQTAWPFAPWVTVLLVVGVIALVAFCYLREISPAGLGYRLLLGILRLTTVALLLVMLSELLLSGVRSGRPSLTLLIDQSSSMLISDPPNPDDVSPFEETTTEQPSRLALAKQTLLQDEAASLEKLAKSYQIRVATFDEAMGPTADGLADMAAAIAAIPAETSEAIAPSNTRLGDAIENAVDGSAGSTPEAVIVLTDGQNTAGSSLNSAAEAARRAGTPLYFLGFGSETSAVDLALSDLLAEDSVFVDDFISFRTTLRASGKIDQPVRVVLRRVGESAVLAAEMVSPQQLENPYQVQVLHRPEEAGNYNYEISVEPLTAEREIENNTLRHNVEVVDKRVRVLLAAGYPNYEYRYLKHLLERNTTVDVEVYLQEADPSYAVVDASALDKLPIRFAELNQYDTIVVMDLDPRLVGRSAWGELRKFVAGGGGLVLVAGPRYLPWAYRNLSEASVLFPNKLAEMPLDGSVTGTAYRANPTELGYLWPTFQLSDSPNTAPELWRGLAPLYWYADLGPLKPTAQVLATHPTATTAAGQPQPLVVTQYVGAGQVLLHAMDSTYRWRLRTGDVYFARYWVQTLRSLARGKLRKAGGLQLTTDRKRYQYGETVRVTLRAADTGLLSKDSVDVLLKPGKGAERRVSLPRDQGNTFRSTLTDLGVGSYRVLMTNAGSLVTATPANTGEENTALPSTSFQITRPPGEFADLEMNRSGMAAAAQRTRGYFAPYQEAEAFWEAIPPSRLAPLETLPPVELWNRWWMLAGITGCLTAEWILRKRKAML